MKFHLFSTTRIAIVVLLPLFLLFKVHDTFYWDWNNHLWMIGYFGEYFRNHLSFPNVINTRNYANIVYPPFYSSLFYRLIGIVSSITGANVAIRISIVLVNLIQFISVYSLIKKISNDYWVGFVVSTLCLWSIYPLTNLYNRSALTEFFAISLLTTAICMWLYSFEVNKQFAKISYRLLFAICFSLAFGFHAITAFFGLIFTVCIIALSIPKLLHEKNHKVNILVGIGIIIYIFVTSFPWILLIVKFVNKLSIITGNEMHYIDGIDNFWVRVAPFPFDYRVIVNGMNIGTPYLDAQINMPLLIVSAFLIFYIFRWYRSKTQPLENKHDFLLLLGSVISLIFFFLISLYGPILSLLPKVFLVAQYAYRFVSYQNIALLVTVVCGLSIVSRHKLYSSIKRPLLFCLLIALTISLMGVVLKQFHANAIINSDITKRSEYNFSREFRSQLLNVPSTMYGTFDYTTLSELDTKTKLEISEKNKINFPVGEGKHFGILTNLEIDLTERSNVALNSYPFTWNHIYVDDKLINYSEMSWDDENKRIIVNLDTGKHTIKAQFEPDPLWDISKKLSFALIMSGLVYSVFFLSFSLYYRMKREKIIETKLGQ
jgi:hypothetical protein